MGMMRVRVEVFAYLTDHGVDTEGLMGSIHVPYIYLINGIEPANPVGGVGNSWLIIIICSLWTSPLPVPPSSGSPLPWLSRQGA